MTNSDSESMVVLVVGLTNDGDRMLEAIIKLVKDDNRAAKKQWRWEAWQMANRGWRLVANDDNNYRTNNNQKIDACGGNDGDKLRQ